MKAVIVGGGKVGYALAANLGTEGHEITVVDNNQRRLDIIEDHLNVNTLAGNATKSQTLRNANVDKSDLVIAVMENDEVNMVTCFMAKNLGAKNTIARVRTPAYSDLEHSPQLKALGIDMLVNPEKITAAEIKKLVEFPEASYVGYFGNGQVLMIEFRLADSCSQLNTPLMEVKTPESCIIIAVERDGELLIPRGNDCLRSGDAVLLLTASKDINNVANFFNIQFSKPRNVTIMSGSLSGYYLAEMLERSGQHYNLKVMEANLDRCKEMEASLRNVVILHTDNPVALFENENINETDVFVACSEDDKENFFASIVAKMMGAKKTITQIRGGDYVRMIEKAGVDKVVSPNGLTTDAILSFINRTSILALTRFNNSQGQVVAYRIADDSPARGRLLSNLDFPKNALICMIIRDKSHIIPSGTDQLLVGDTAIVFSMPETMAAVEKKLTGTRGA